MKTNITLLIFLLFSGISTRAQETINKTDIPSKKVINVYRDVDVMAKYPGGYENLLKEIEHATKNCKNGSMKKKKATFVIDVLVSKTGNVTLVNFTESPTNLCKNDIKKAIENSKKWAPSKIKPLQ